MANIQNLQAKVENAQKTVEKRKATLERHEVRLEKMKKNGGFGSWEIKSKEEDIVSAGKKLVEAEEVLSNWQAKLDVEIEKERFLEGNAPQVIKNFLANWKQMAHEWHVKRYDEYVALKEDLKAKQKAETLKAYRTLPEFARYFNEDGTYKYGELRLMGAYNWNEAKAVDAYLEPLKLDNKTVKATLSLFAGAAVLMMATCYDEDARLAWLEKTLEEERKRKMLDLINRINKVTGSITDATALRIDVNGNLNGIVKGEKGTAKVETIGAGGYAIQCFHYRTLVHEIK